MPYNLPVPYVGRPKLAQHYLTDTRYRERIAEALDLRADELVVEIGAGRGAMTRLLAERAWRVVAVELDAALAETLRENLQPDPRLEIVHADILQTDLAAICRRHRTEQCFVFGSLPYYITSPILHRLFDYRTRIRAMALVVQREVAERLTATPGRRAYGYLSVAAQLYSRPRIVLGVPPGAFSPKPKVHSALVGFQMAPRFPDWKSQTGEEFLEFVKRCFAQKRKSLLNNLRGLYPRALVEEEVARLGLPATARAEELALEQLAGLTQGLQSRSL